jgi:hypothetical protein
MVFRCVSFVVGFALSLAVSGSAFAQTQFTGRIDVTVQDSTGGVVPGATVELSGQETHAATTDARGEAHFLNLEPGTYQVKVTLSGFQDYLNRNVPVIASGTVPLSVSLGVSGVSAQVNVTGSVPMVDIKKNAAVTNVTLEELQGIPSARDPWVVLQSVPTVMVDRVNVGGSESGQQSNYYAKGAPGTANTWNIDGIPITDAASAGSSPTYYDFDSFQEISVTTGGADVNTTSPGVQLNFVMKSGSNTPHGDARFFFENESLQGNNLSPAIATQIGSTTGMGNRTASNKDRGFDLGGPIIKDKLWAWGSYGRTNVDNLTLINTHDTTQLENVTLKINAQPTSWFRPEFMYFRGNKVKFGRGASALHPPETTWDQTGPSTVYKGQVGFTIGDSLVLTTRGAHSINGFSLTPEGGLNTPSYRDTNQVWHGSYEYFATNRPQDSFVADGNWFHGRHEVKFGFSWRHASVTSTSIWPGGGIFTEQRASYATTGAVTAFLVRDFYLASEASYYGGYAADTIRLNRLTLNLALRWDDAHGSPLAVTQPATVLPSLLPAITAPGVPGAIKQSLPQPRLGFTYAVDEKRKTIVKGSYSLFMTQIGSGNFIGGAFVSPAAYSYAVFHATDTNRNGQLDASELAAAVGGRSGPALQAAGVLVGYGGFNPANPTSVQAFNKIDPNLVAPRTHEIVGGVEREVMPNLAVGVDVTYRRYNDVYWQPLAGVTASDYTLDHTLTGNAPGLGAYSVPVYALNASAAPLGGGRELSNRPGYHQTYMGAEFTLTKRMSNRWMARVGFSTNSDKEYFDNPATSIADPTPRVDATSNNYSLLGFNQNGGTIIRSSAGSGKSNLYVVPAKWQIVANGVWQGPWGLNFGGNILGRQGFAQLYYSSNEASADPVEGSKDVIVSPNADSRLPSVWSVDGRVEKLIKLQRLNLMLDLDVFNILNAGTTLRNQYDVSAGTFGNVLEIMNPRIARLGVRITF